MVKAILSLSKIEAMKPIEIIQEQNTDLTISEFDTDSIIIEELYPTAILIDYTTLPTLITALQTIYNEKNGEK